MNLQEELERKRCKTKVDLDLEKVRENYLKSVKKDYLTFFSKKNQVNNDEFLDHEIYILEEKKK